MSGKGDLPDVFFARDVLDAKRRKEFWQAESRVKWRETGDRAGLFALQMLA